MKRLGLFLLTVVMVSGMGLSSTALAGPCDDDINGIAIEADLIQFDTKTGDNGNTVYFYKNKSSTVEGMVDLLNICMDIREVPRVKAWTMDKDGKTTSIAECHGENEYLFIIVDKTFIAMSGMRKE